jgi:hypothetical protein
MGPGSRTPSGPAVPTDCINRPDRRLHPTTRQIINSHLQCGSHPQRTKYPGASSAGTGGKRTFPAARYTESDPLRTWTIPRIDESGRGYAARQGHAWKAIAVSGGKCAEALGKVWCGWHQREPRHFQSIDCRPAHLCSGVALTSISVTKQDLASSRRNA